MSNRTGNSFAGIAAALFVLPVAAFGQQVSFGVVAGTSVTPDYHTVGEQYQDSDFPNGLSTFVRYSGPRSFIGRANALCTISIAVCISGALSGDLADRIFRTSAAASSPMPASVSSPPCMGLVKVIHHAMRDCRYCRGLIWEKALPPSTRKMGAGVRRVGLAVSECAYQNQCKSYVVSLHTFNLSRRRLRYYCKLSLYYILWPYHTNIG